MLVVPSSTATSGVRNRIESTTTLIAVLGVSANAASKLFLISSRPSNCVPSRSVIRASGWKSAASASALWLLNASTNATTPCRTCCSSAEGAALAAGGCWAQAEAAKAQRKGAAQMVFGAFMIRTHQKECVERLLPSENSLEGGANGKVLCLPPRHRGLAVAPWETRAVAPWETRAVALWETRVVRLQLPAG